MLDLTAIRQAVGTHGAVMRVVIASVRGSSPREVGAAMLVWPGGQSGTIGGGALELAASEAALRRDAPIWQSAHALGPELGQCCGGAVVLVFERWDAARLGEAEGEVYARAVQPGDMPLTVRRLLSDARGKGTAPDAQLLDGWLVEPVYKPSRPLWVWGAGHVGRAIVSTLAPLPDYDITWIDTAPDRFPDVLPDRVAVVPAADPVRLATHAPRDAAHLVLTYSHALDLDLCHALLQRGFGFAGLIGSATKWARFRNRLRDLGHAPDVISQITCPIGDPSLGKHPQSIAIGVAGQLLRLQLAGADHKNREKRA